MKNPGMSKAKLKKWRDQRMAFIDVRAAAAYLECTVAEVHRRVKTGKIKAVRRGQGSKIYVDVTSVFRPPPPSPPKVAEAPTTF